VTPSSGVRPALISSSFYMALCLSGASDWEGALIRELGPESLARHHIFPRSLFRAVGEEEG